MTQIETGRLRLGEVVPDFALESIDGSRVSPRAYKQRMNLVIAYMDFDRCSSCTTSVRSFAESYPEYRALETELLVVSPQAIGDLRGRFGALGIPFPVLSDPEGRMTGAYFGDVERDAAAAVFITDRYGALRAELLSSTTSDLAGQREILDWLNLIEIECPECGE